MNLSNLFNLDFGNFRMFFTRKFWIAFGLVIGILLITVKFESHYRIVETNNPKDYTDTWLRPSNLINGLGIYIRDGWYFLARYTVALCNFLGSFLPEVEDCLNILNAIGHFLWYSIFSYPWGFIKYTCDYATKHYIVVGTLIAIGIISLLCYLLRDYLKRFFRYLETFRCIQTILGGLKMIPNGIQQIKNLVIVTQRSGAPSPDICGCLCCCVPFMIFVIGWIMAIILILYNIDIGK